ncbi:thioredoxin domain-containing protein [Patulibacter minatonensis]|uniref:thioredoxin domain-containing protein n=1 Tax=Patulibacter minatonensis TaxID=298163 RepID=UPI00047DBA65|nr:thioredoxin domain-containing protein [Patulibacter minatonensis]
MSELDDAVARNRRGQLVGLGFLAAVILVAVLIGSGAFSGDDPAKKAKVVDGVRGPEETAKLLRGIPQNGLVLGRPDAPATVVEFVDVKCPFCKNFALKDGPDVIEDLVRTGRANLELRVLDNLGRSSGDGRTAIHAAAEKNQAWTLSELLYYNQKSEGEEWVTPALLQRMNRVAPEFRGLTLSTTRTPETERLDAQTDALAKELDFGGKTPTIYVRPRGRTDKGAYRKVDLKGTGSKADKIADAVAKVDG